jgi:predicted DNA-binding transcriptional regulator YafY
MNRTDRLVGILLELQARGTLRAEDLAAHFEVSVRTMYRDLEALAESGVPLVATPGTGYRLMAGYFLPPLHFTAAEAALLVLGSELVRQRVDAELQAAAETALHKLSSVLPADRRDAVARWRRELLFVPPRRASDARLARLRTAITERRVVRLEYHAFRRPAPETREVEPFSLVYLNERWQLAAYCRLRQGPRLFRLDRIDSFTVRGERFSLGERHTTPSAERGQPQAPVARVRFEPSVERWVRERQPFTLLGEEHDACGPVFLYAIVHQDDLVQWLLSWGSSVEVLEPASLRARLADEARALLSRHAPAPDTTVARALLQAGLEV